MLEWVEIWEEQAGKKPRLKAEHIPQWRTRFGFDWSFPSGLSPENRSRFNTFVMANAVAQKLAVRVTVCNANVCVCVCLWVGREVWGWRLNSWMNVSISAIMIWNLFLFLFFCCCFGVLSVVLYCVNEIRIGGFSFWIQWHPMQQQQQQCWTATITVSVTVTPVTRVLGVNKTILSIHSHWILCIFL